MIRSKTQAHVKVYDWCALLRWTDNLRYRHNCTIYQSVQNIKPFILTPLSHLTLQIHWNDIISLLHVYTGITVSYRIQYSKKNQQKKSKTHFLKKTQNNGGTWIRIRNHILRRKKKGITSSTDCQLVSVERLGWRRRLFEQNKKNAIGTSSQAHSTPELPIYPLPLNTHPHTPSSGIVYVC